MKKKITTLITIILTTLLLFLNMNNVYAAGEDEENVVLYNFTRFYEYTGQVIKPTDLVLTYNDETLVEATYDEVEGKYVGDYILTYPTDCTSVGRKEVSITLVDEDETYVFSGETRTDSFYYYICDKLIQLWDYDISDGMTVELSGGLADPFDTLENDYSAYITVTDGTASGVGEYTTTIKNKNDKYVIIEYKDQYNSSYYRELKTSDDQLEVNWYAKRAIFTENDERIRVDDLENIGYNIGSSLLLEWNGNVSFGDTLQKGTDYDINFYIPALDEGPVAYLFDTDADGTVYDLILQIDFKGNYGGYVNKTIKLCPSIDSAEVELLEGATQEGENIQFQYGLNTPPFNLTMEIKGETKTLVYGTDFTIHSSYFFMNVDNPNEIPVTGIGDYAGTRYVRCVLTPKSINDSTMKYYAEENAYYNGEDTYLGVWIYDLNYSEEYTIDSTDYEITYNLDTDNNTGVATITGKGNYVDSFTVDFILARRNNSELSWEIKWEAYYDDYDAMYYTEEQRIPSTVFKYGNEVMVEGVDYELSLTGWKLGEILNLKYKLKGNYYGENSIPFKLAPIMVEGLEPYVIKTGSAATLNLVIKDTNGNLLTKNTDYTISYEDNTEYGTAKYTITLLDDEDTITGKFRVISKVITKDDTSLEIEGLDNGDYTIGVSDNYSPNPFIYYSGDELVKDTDYTIATVLKDSAGNVLIYGSDSGISSEQANGSIYYATTTITFMGQYYGTLVYDTLFVPRIDTATLVPKDDGRTEIGYLYYEYTGSNIVPDFDVIFTVDDEEITLIKDTDYEIVEIPEEMINVGNDYSFYVNGKGNYGGSIYVMLEIEALDSSYVDVECNGYALYTGEEVTPTIILTDKYNNTLIEDTDYEINYSDNVELGNGSYEISFIGNYSGDPKTGTFRIVSIEITEDDLGNKLIIDNYGKPQGYNFEELFMPSAINSIKYIVDAETTNTLASDDYSYSMEIVDDENNQYVNGEKPCLTVENQTGKSYKIKYSIEFYGNYGGTINYEVDLLPSLSSATVTFKDYVGLMEETPVYEYTGNKILPSIDKVTIEIDGTERTLLASDYELEEISEYDYIEFGNDFKRINLVGTGNYPGTLELIYFIRKYISEDELGDKLVIEGLDEANHEYSIGISNNQSWWSGAEVTYNGEEVQYTCITEVVDLDGNTYVGMNGDPGLDRDDANGDVYYIRYTFEFDGDYYGKIVYQKNKYCPSIENVRITYKNNHSMYDDKPTYLYTGDEILPSIDKVTITKKGEEVELVLGQDVELRKSDMPEGYYVNYSENIREIVLYGIGDYSGSQYVNYYISKYNLDDAIIISSGAYAETPNPVIIFNNDVLDSDYYDLEDLVDSFKITGKGLYSGTRVINYIRSNEYDLEDQEITISLAEDSRLTEDSSIEDITYLFTGEEIIPLFDIKRGETKLVLGTDYAVYAYNNIDPQYIDGSFPDVPLMKIYLYGQGNYGGILNYTATIKMTTLDTTHLSYRYTGSVIDLSTHNNPNIYSVTSDDEIIDAGTYTVSVKGVLGYGFKVNDKYVLETDEEITVDPYYLTGADDITFELDKESYGAYKDGRAIEPLITYMKLENENIEFEFSEDDYEINSYEDNTSAGTGKINVKLLTDNILLSDINYLTLTFEIREHNLEDYFSTSDINFDYSNDNKFYMLYTGESLKPEVNILDLTEDLDYELDYDDNLENTGTIYIKGIGDYAGNISVEFIITENVLLATNSSIKYVDNLQAYQDPTYISTGSQIKPKIKVIFNEEELSEDDYSVEYGENLLTNGSITITGKGDYVGILESSFEILNYKLEDAEIELNGYDEELEDGTLVYYYDGNNPELYVESITYNGLRFEEGAEIEEYDFTNPGEYTVTLYGVGDFYGEVTYSFKTLVTVVEDLKIEYSGEAVTGEALLAASNYENVGLVTEIAEAINAGTYNVSLRLNKGYALFKEDEYLTEGVTPFEIYAKELSKDDLTINIEGDYYYTGEDIIPSFTLSYGEIALDSELDYSFELEDNKNAGKASIVITLKNNYKNSSDISYPFDIYYDVSQAEIILNGMDGKDDDGYYYLYDGTNPTITASLKFNDEVFENSAEIEEYDIENPGRHVLKINGINNFKGNTEIGVYTRVTSVSGLQIVYTNSIITAEELIKANNLTEAIAEVIEIDEAKAVGTYNVVLKANKGYGLVIGRNEYVSQGIMNFKVVQKELSQDDLSIELDELYLATGEELKPDFTLKYGDVILVKDTDFEYDYANNVSAGTGLIGISMKGNYSSSEPIMFEFVIKYDFTKAEIKLSGFDSLEDNTYIYLYDGTNPTITVSRFIFNGDRQDISICTIEEYDIKEPGTYKIIVKGDESYDGQIELDSKTIVEVIKDLKIEFEYNEDKQIQGSALIDANDLSNKANVVSIDDAYNVGTYNVTLELNRGYALYQDNKYLTSGEIEFEVYAKVLYKEDLGTEYEEIFYATGSEIKPNVSIYFDDVELVESKDFDITYSNNIIPGTAKFEVVFKGNYKNAEKIEYEYEIKAKTMYNSEITYTGKTIYMMDVLKEYGLDEAILKIKNGDYSAKYAGTYTCYVVLKDGFSFDDAGLITEGEYSWTILPFEINIDDVVVEINKQAYTGSAIIPAINISYNNGEISREIRVEDYDLTLENNINVGTAKATIKLKNNFICEGEIVKEFEIFDPDAPFKAYRTRVVKSLDSYLSDEVAKNLASNIGKLATAADIKELYLTNIPTILANKLLSMGGYITSIKNITESDYDGLVEILAHYNDLEKYVSDNKYTLTINTVLEEQLLTDAVLTEQIKAVLDLLVSDLGYTSFESFITDLTNASTIEKEKAEAIETIEKQIRTCYKVTVLTVLEHQKEEMKAQEYITQTDDDSRNDYLENFKEEVYRQRILYQIQLQHQMAQARSINSVTEIYDNLLQEHTYNDIEKIKLKDLLDEYVEAINALEMCQTEEEEVELIYQMADMAEKVIYDLYEVGVANIVSDECIISSSTGINKDAVVKVEINKNISSNDIINAKNNGIISDINKTDEELKELVDNKEVLRVMDISIVKKDEVVNDFDGVYTVKIPLDNDLKNVNNPVVVYINADGTLEVLETYIDGDYLIFKTTHFSNYAVIGNKIVDLGWLLILLLTTFFVEVFIVIYLIKVTKPFKSKKAMLLLTILPSGFVGYLITLVILNIIGIAAIIYLIVRFNKSFDKEVDKNE